ncbi:MAG: PQQ-binding-like beta-propeller repeat protein [Planctomycetota bacterium]|nr:PQQ-binding-like beta-propeller repeat protein [Planctomycetota bacterium]
MLCFSKTFIILALILPLLPSAELRAEDWPQWRGPGRDGMSRETEWIKDWPVGGTPRVAWRSAVGKGHSALSIAEGRAYTMGWDGEQDTTFCFDAATGKLVWKQSYPCKTILQWPGPRATPTVYGGAVYTLGQHGQLRAWDARTGKPLWQRDLPDDYNPDVDYGFAWSPLIEGDLLILNAGSRGLAIRTRDGSIAWGDDGKKAACVSAVPFEHNGRRGVLVVSINADRSAASLVGVDPRSGRELWRFDGWKEQWGAMGVDPVVHDGKVFIQTGASGDLIIADADPTGYRELRRTRVFDTDGHTFTAPVLANGRICCRSYAGEVVCFELR